MTDRELLLERLERLAIVLDELMPQCAELVRDAVALLKEQEERLDSIVCFENGDKVRLWNCPLCKSEVRIVLKGQPEIIRCMDCKHYQEYFGIKMSYCTLMEHEIPSSDWFCADGVRKEG